MARRPTFDPSRTAAAQAAAERGDDEDRAWSVSELAGRIEAALRRGLPGRVRVMGEVSGLRERTHLYFDLKDADAVINAVLFASGARRLGFAVEQGVSVIASGRVDFYKPSGRVSLIVDSLEPVGAGALEARLRAMIEELRGLGWLDAERKRPLPVFPRRVAVVTSRSGAALQDVIDTLRRRCPAVGLLVVDSRVQGEGAAAEIAHAIRAIGLRHAELGVDAILVTRGGGSMEDLWAFNERVVAEAIVTSPAPVVAAIGHETDVTVADLVADERCATPTQAAMRLSPDREELRRQLDALERRASSRLRGLLEAESRRVASLGGRRVLSAPATVIASRADRLGELSRRLPGAWRGLIQTERRLLAEAGARLERRRPIAEHARRGERVAALTERLERVAARATRARRDSLEQRLARLTGAVRRDLDRQSDRVTAYARELDAVGPRGVLARGYSCTLDGSGRAVRSVGGVRPGGRIVTVVQDGRFGSVVEGGASRDADAAKDPETLRAARNAARPVAGAKGPQLDLFGKKG